MGGQVSTPDKKRPLPPASESSDEGFEETKDAAAAAVEKVKVPLSSEATVVAARRAFLEGNQMFRESKFSAAQQCYETALRILREHFVTPEQVRNALALLLAHVLVSFHAQQLQLRTCRAGAHGAATALTNLGVLEFSAGRYDEAKVLLTEALALRQQEGLSAASVAAHVTAPANLCVGMDALEGLDSLAIELSRNRVFWQAPVQHQVRELPLSLFSPSRMYNSTPISASYVPPPLPLARQAMATRLQTHSHVDAVTADAMNNLAVRVSTARITAHHTRHVLTLLTLPPHVAVPVCSVTHNQACLEVLGQVQYAPPLTRQPPTLSTVSRPWPLGRSLPLLLVRRGAGARGAAAA